MSALPLPRSEPGRERLAFAALALVAVLGWALIPTYPNYDAYWHLVWGRELMDGINPGFETYSAPTQHPLYLALCALLSLIGEDADRALVLFTVLSLVALVWGAYRLGRAVFGVWPGVVGALAVGSSFAFLLYAVRAYVDVPFLAVVLWAGALEAARPRERLAPMALLAVAGLLRPEAWVLAGLLLLWHWSAADARRRVGLVVLTGISPAIWALVDLAVTGDPLFSLNSTSALAETLGRKRGLSNVPSSFVEYLTDVARPPVALAGAAGVALAVRKWGWRPLIVPLALFGAGVITFVGTGILGLSILPRYLTVPAVALCVFAGYAVMGWTREAPGEWRERWRRASYAMLALGIAFVGIRVGSFNRLRGELRFNKRTHEQIAALVRDPQIAAALRGPAVTVSRIGDDAAGTPTGYLTLPTYRVVPDVLWVLDVRRGRVLARSSPAARRLDLDCAIEVYVRGTRKEVTRFGEADGVPRSTNRTPKGSPELRRGPFVVNGGPCTGTIR